MVLVRTLVSRNGRGPVSSMKRYVGIVAAAHTLTAPTTTTTSIAPTLRAPYCARLHTSTLRRQASEVHHGVDEEGHQSPVPTSKTTTSAVETDDGHASEHAVLSTFDLFSIGIGPSSSHTVGPMRAGAIFVNDLKEADLLDKVATIRIALYGSLAATGEGHMTPSALLLGLEGADCETIDPANVPTRFEEIKQSGKLYLSGQQGREISFNYRKDFVFEFGRTLPLHSNGMRLTVFDVDGTMLATNDLFSVGGGFVVNGALSTAATSSSAASTSKANGVALQGSHPVDLAENVYYKEIKRFDAAADRRSGIDPSNMSSVVSIEGEQPPSLLDDTFESQGLASISKSTSDVANTPRVTISSQPPYLFRDAKTLIALCKKHNLTIAQLVYENERHWYTDEEIRQKLTNIWLTMDNCIREGAQSGEDVLPGSLKLKRRAPALYQRLTRGLYPSIDRPFTSSPGSSSLRSSSAAAPETAIGKQLGAAPETGLAASRGLTGSASKGPPRVHGSFQHPILPTPPRKTIFPTMDHLTVYAMAVNEVNAAGGRVVTAPTNGAAGIIPAVLKYIVEFISDDEERDVFTFLLTSAAIAMLYKRGATISAAEGGCMSEIGVACSMSAASFAACMGASLETIEQAAEIGIEHNLGLTCDPIGGLVQAPCIERNGIGAVKAVVSANLAMSSPGGKVSLDDAIKAMKLTAEGMRTEFKETSMSGLATSVRIPVSVPDC